MKFGEDVVKKETLPSAQSRKNWAKLLRTVLERSDSGSRLLVWALPTPAYTGRDHEQETALLLPKTLPLPALHTTIGAFRKCLTPESWEQFAKANGIWTQYAKDDETLTVFGHEITQYELSDELRSLLDDAKELAVRFAALGITFD